MKGDSRKKKSLLNARVNLICYFVALIVAFFSRKIFLDFLGAEFLGLTETIAGFLGFFNLAESGIGVAIAFLLYKPIFDGDKEKINELISVFGYLYHLVGFFILGVGIVFSLFLPLIFPSTTFSWGVIYFVFYASVFSSLLGYFVNYPQILLSADQRNYEVTGYYQAVTVAQTMIQIVLIYVVNSYYVFISFQLLFSIIYSVILYWRINKVYPWLKNDVKLGKKIFTKYPEIGKYIKQIFIHKIGGFAHYQLIPVLIYSYVSLPVVALYKNYTLIGGKLNALVSSVLGSTSAGVGSIIAEGDKRKIMEIYEKLFSIDTLAAGIISACIYRLSSPFIYIWLGAEYVLDDIVILLISIEYFLGILRLSNDQFIQGSGLFSDIWSPIVEIVILVVVSVVFGSLWGLKGILLGPILSCFVLIYLWKPYFLFSKGFHLPLRIYWSMFIKHVFAFGISFLCASFFSDFTIKNIPISNGWGQWILNATTFSLFLIGFTIIFISIISKPFRSLINEFSRKIIVRIKGNC